MIGALTKNIESSKDIFLKSKEVSVFCTLISAKIVVTILYSDEF